MSRAKLIKEGRKPEHNCNIELPSWANDQAVYQCTCGKFYLYHAFAYDDDGDWVPYWSEVDKHGCELVRVPLPKKKWYHRREYKWVFECNLEPCRKAQSG